MLISVDFIEYINFDSVMFNLKINIIEFSLIAFILSVFKVVGRHSSVLDI